jgi:hypothetical protein
MLKTCWVLIYAWSFVFAVLPIVLLSFVALAKLLGYKPLISFSNYVFVSYYAFLFSEPRPPYKDYQI